MKREIIAISISLLLILGVVILNISNKDIKKVDEVLNGESEHWSVEYHINGFMEYYAEDEQSKIRSDGTYEMRLTYKGLLEEIDELRMIEINVLDKTIGYKTSEKPGDLEFVFRGNLNYSPIIAVANKKEIKLAISWDGLGTNEESLELK